MNEIEFGGKKFTGPDSWEKMKAAQYLQWVRWQLSGAAHVGLYALLKLWFKLKSGDLRLLDDDQRATLVDTVFAFMSERPTHWMLPRVNILLREYRGPGDRLQYLTFGEYMFAESVRKSIDGMPTHEQMAELAASIYRPYDSKREGKRAAFDAATYDDQIRRFERLSKEVLHGILINYYGCQDQLVTRFEHLYKGSSSESGSGGTWLDVGLNLARQTTALGSFHEL